MSDNDQLDFYDDVVDVAHAIQKHGAKTILKELGIFYPEQYRELISEITSKPKRQLPYLLDGTKSNN